MYHFYDTETNNFSWRDFEGEREIGSGDTVLVHCLAAAGWLGGIALLAPHRAEFLGLLQEDFGLGQVSETPMNLAEKFLKAGFDTIAPETRPSGTLEEFQNLQGEQLVQSFGGKAELAKEFFKLLQCIKGSWRIRLMAWDRLLALGERENFDPTPYLQEEVFLKVKHRLDRIRGRNRSMNNFNDALAMAILAVRVRKFNENPSDSKLPLFFDHAGDLQKAIKKSHVEDALIYRNNGQAFSVLRDWRYFFLRATFGHLGQERHSKKEINDLLRQTKEIRERRKNLNKEARRALGSTDSDVDQQIENMKEFRFFGNVWLRSWKSDLKRVISDLRKANILERRLRFIEELQGAEIQEKFQQAQKTLTQHFEGTVGLYQGVTDLLKAIDSRAKDIHQGLVKQNRDESDIVLILGSFRFPFTFEARNEIATVLSGLASKETKKQAEAQERIISALNKSRSGEPLQADTLALLLGVLWATEVDREILDLEKSQRSLVAGSQFGGDLAPSLVWIAALVRETFEDKRYEAEIAHAAERQETQRKEDLRRASRRLEQIEDFYSTTQGGEEKARLAISLAYINFHIFTALESKKSVLWPEDTREKHGSPRDLLDKAIRYAQSAASFELDDKRLHVYALNLVLYYMAEGVRWDGERFGAFRDQLDEAARLLLKHDQKGQEGWHYRYDDSLARYYEVLGQGKNDPEDWEKGQKRIVQAENTCYADPVIKIYHQEFHDHYSQWRDKH